MVLSVSCSFFLLFHGWLWFISIPPKSAAPELNPWYLHAWSDQNQSAPQISPLDLPSPFLPSQVGCKDKTHARLFHLFSKCAERSRRVSWAKLVALGSHSVKHVPQDSLHFIPGPWARSTVGFEKGRCQSVVRVLQCLCNFNELTNAQRVCPGSALPLAKGFDSYRNLYSPVALIFQIVLHQLHGTKTGFQIVWEMKF